MCCRVQYLENYEWMDLLSRHIFAYGSRRYFQKFVVILMFVQYCQMSQADTTHSAAIARSSPIGPTAFASLGF